jgi:hypothetical protein
MLARGKFAPVAQLDRAVASEATGREFESLRAHHSPLSAKNTCPDLRCQAMQKARSASDVSMRNRKFRPYLVDSGSDMGPGQKVFETGMLVPETGIYLVVHSAHRLPHEVVVIKGQRFPRCKECGDTVLFELLHAAPDLYGHTTKIVFELPVVDDAGDPAPV